MNYGLTSKDLVLYIHILIMMEKLHTYAQTLGISLSEHQIQQFELLQKELLNWNAHTNLTAITEPDEIITKHFLDSLTLMPHIPPSARMLIDIGSGAGFPGLPIAIARPELHITLLDAVAKKTAFHTHIIETLSLPNVTTIHARAEELAHDSQYREQYDIATARAVAELATLCEYTLPFIKPGGICIAQKSTESAHQEATQSTQALLELGGAVKEITPITIPELSDRSLIIIEKISPTPGKYPRRSGVPSKRPL
jgi:16S rRNA (guanine527-N7)-methyltransferase